MLFVNILAIFVLKKEIDKSFILMPLCAEWYHYTKTIWVKTCPFAFLAKQINYVPITLWFRNIKVSVLHIQEFLLFFFIISINNIVSLFAPFPTSCEQVLMLGFIVDRKKSLHSINYSITLLNEPLYLHVCYAIF